MEIGRTLMAQKFVALKYWDDAFLTAIFLIITRPLLFFNLFLHLKNVLIFPQIILHYEFFLVFVIYIYGGIIYIYCNTVLRIVPF